MIFFIGGTLRDPVNSCNCDQRNAINDRQTVAFYNMYKTAVESPFNDEDAVVSKYQTIARPESTFPRLYKAAKNQYPMKNPRQIIALKPLLSLRYITNNAVQERFPRTESNAVQYLQSFFQAFFKKIIISSFIFLSFSFLWSLSKVKRLI